MGLFGRFFNKDGKKQIENVNENNELSKLSTKTAEVKFKGTIFRNGNTYEEYRCTDPEIAKDFLLKKKVNKNQYYITVDTSDGGWGTDIEGLFKQRVFPWQNQIESADIEGFAISMPNMFSLSVAARGIVDNFVAMIECGNCKNQWFEGLRYQNWTVAICPKCSKKNRVNSERFKVMLSNNFNDQSAENMRFTQDKQATISNTTDKQFIKLASVRINTSIEAVWKFFIDPPNWEKWYGGALLEVKPDWLEGGELIWKLGYPSRIKKIIPMKIFETVSNPSLNIVRWTFSEDNGGVLFEREDKFIGTKIADMEKVLQNNQSKLDNFKKLVERRTAQDERDISHGNLEIENTPEKDPHLQIESKIGITCPSCKGKLNETNGSPISPYINLYTCTKCSWRGLKCGRRDCDGILKEEKMSYSDIVRYECTQCGWSCTGPKLVWK